MQGLGGEGPQLARQGEASRGAILGELWGPRGELLKRHELGNLQRTQCEQMRKTAEGEGGEGGVCQVNKGEGQRTERVRRIR